MPTPAAAAGAVAGIADQSLGAGTNALTRNILMRPSSSQRNYLLAAQRRLSARDYARTAAAAAAIDAGEGKQ